MAIKKHKILRYNSGISSSVIDNLAVEEPLQISIVSEQVKKDLAVTMRTPGADKALAIGFLYSEGILKDLSQLITIEEEENKVVLQVKDLDDELAKLDRNFYISSSCGVCGKASIEALEFSREIAPPLKTVQFTFSQIFALQEEASKSQKTFHETGGIHAATIFNREGKVILQHEDDGRHNALDKVIGSGLVDKLVPFDNNVLLLSGRASFELLQKAIIAGIQIVVAIGAPSSLAVQLAEEYDVTLIGFLKGKSFNIYTASHRII